MVARLASIQAIAGIRAAAWSNLEDGEEVGDIKEAVARVRECVCSFRLLERCRLNLDSTSVACFTQISTTISLVADAAECLLLQGDWGGGWNGGEEDGGDVPMRVRDVCRSLRDSVRERGQEWSRLGRVTAVIQVSAFFSCSVTFSPR